MTSLFDSLDVGGIHAKNRIFMSPLTRGRSTQDHTPTPIMAGYYAQRAGAGLIISEATGISQEGLGWPFAPGIWRQDQVEAWKPIVEANHKAGGKIILQMWHMGRLVHPSFLGGAKPVSSSATTAPGEAHTYAGKVPYEEARALAIDEIPRLLEDYARAARNAIAAGFDGVQIHAANGYLIDEFLRDNSNFRDDDYGGSPENRARLLVEVTQSVINEVGKDRTAVRLSPNGDSQGVDDSNPAALFAVVAEKLNALDIAFLELREQGSENGGFGQSDVPKQAPLIRQYFRNPLVLNGDYSPELAQATLESGLADAIAFGRPFITNPDLVARIKTGAPLTPWADNSLWYGNGGASAEGYTDYPALTTQTA